MQRTEAEKNYPTCQPGAGEWGTRARLNIGRAPNTFACICQSLLPESNCQKSRAVALTQELFWPCLEAFLVLVNVREEVLPATSEWRPRVLLSIPVCTGQTAQQLSGPK